MFPVTSLFNLPFDTGLALVQTAFQDDEGVTHYYDNHQDAFSLVDVANADEWAAETDAGAVLLVTKTGAGQYEIEIAERGMCIQHCYACGRLYIEDRDYVDSLMRCGSYDPTDYACGCTSRWLEAEAEAVNDGMHTDPCDNDCDLCREWDASIRQAVLAQDWRA